MANCTRWGRRLAEVPPNVGRYTRIGGRYTADRRACSRPLNCHEIAVDVSASPIPAFPVTPVTDPTAAAGQVLRLDIWIEPSFARILGTAPAVRLDTLAQASEPAEAASILASANVYQISAAKDELPPQWFATGALLARCPDLLCVSSSGAGYDTVDVAACTRAGVAVVNQNGGNAQSVAEHTLAMIVSLTHRLVECDRRMRTETGLTREIVMGSETAGKTLGIVGIGEVGRRVARLARAFGLEVIATDPLFAEDEIRARGAEPVSLAELLRQADVVSLHCPRDATTVKSFDAKAFRAMKPGSFFVTTARGGIHDEAALHQALASGHLAGAGIDVWDREPPPLDHPLLALPNVFATYHTAGVTHEARRRIASGAAAQILDLLAGQRPPRLVNPEVWPTVRTRFERILGRQAAQN